MKATLELFFFGVLACSTLVATCAMLINFPRMRAAQQAMLMNLNSLADTHRVTFQVYDAKVNQLEARVRQLEDTHA